MTSEPNLENFRRDRVKLKKVVNKTTSTYRIGKGSMAIGVKKTLLPKERYEDFLKMHNL